jgi:hypothetical protein
MDEIIPIFPSYGLLVEHEWEGMCSGIKTFNYELYEKCLPEVKETFVKLIKLNLAPRIGEQIYVTNDGDGFIYFVTRILYYDNYIRYCINEYSLENRPRS